VHRADGRWRLYAFGDEGGQRLCTLAQWLTDAADAPIARFTPAGADLDSVIDVRAVFRADHHDVELGALPEILLPRTGPLGLQDWEKVWATGQGADVFAARGVAAEGAVVIVRPDQYVAHVLPLDARDELTAFFGGFLCEARR
jgi:phenol 2-monooxygenase